MPNNDHDEVISYKLYARLAIIGAVFYPGWAIFISFAAPDRYDDPVGRMVVGACFLLVAIFSYKLRSWTIPAVQIVATLCMVHFSSMIALGGAENSLLFFWLITATGLFFGFLNHPWRYFFHAVIVGICLIAFTKATGVFDESIRYTGQMILIFLVKVLLSKIFRSHSELIASLRKEKLQLLEKQQQLILKGMQDSQSVFTALGAGHDALPEQIKLRPFYRPAADAGGDWVGTYYSKEKNWVIVSVGDVTGHDPVSSLVTIAVAGAVRGAYDCMVDTAANIEELVDSMGQSANQAVIHVGIAGKSMSAGFVGLDLNSGVGYYLSCGHLPLILKAASKAAQNNGSSNKSDVDILTPGPSSLLGQSAQISTGVAFDVKGAQSLVLYTDGVVEQGGKKLSIPRLKRLVAGDVDVYNALQSHVEGKEPDDDVTFLVVDLLQESQGGMLQAS